MKRIIIEKSVFKSVGYGWYSSKLEIEFINGEVVQYLKIPPEIYEEFLKLDFCNQFFKKSIDNIYDFKKV